MINSARAIFMFENHVFQWSSKSKKIPNQPQLKGTDHNRFMGTCMSFLTIYGHTIMSIWLKTVLTCKYWVWVVRGLQLRQHLALQASQVCHNFSLHTYSRASQLLFRVYAFKFYGCLAQHCNKQVSLKDSAVILLLGTGKVLLRVPSNPVILKGRCVLHKERGCKTESEQSAMW